MLFPLPAMPKINFIQLVKQLPACCSHCIGKTYKFVLIAYMLAQVINQLSGHVQRNLRHTLRTLFVVLSITLVIAGEYYGG
jgi:hypothetical protein